MGHDVSLLDSVARRAWVRLGNWLAVSTNAGGRDALLMVFVVLGTAGRFSFPPFAGQSKPVPAAWEGPQMRKLPVFGAKGTERYSRRAGHALASDVMMKCGIYS
jgi:hypothetical protein